MAIAANEHGSRLVQTLLSGEAMRALLLSLLSLLFLSTACGDDGATSPDASSDSPDAATVDAEVDPTPDAAPVPPDAGPETLCGRLCATILTCFDEGGGGEECEAGCSADLADCSLDELGSLDSCSTLGCEEIVDCIVAVPCIDEGGKGGGCGDGTCDPDEDCAFCPDDCGACVCGDTTCSPGECATCAGDCPGGCVCPHDTCTAGELLDPGCDPCVGQVCAVDDYCCTTEWDGTCVGEAQKICGKDCGVEPPPVDGGVPDVDAMPSP